MKISFILKKVQMTPALLLRIMDLTPLSLAFRTSEGAARRKVKLNIEGPFFRRKLIGNHKPLTQPYGLLKKFFVFHNRTFYESENIFSIYYPHKIARNHLLSRRTAGLAEGLTATWHKGIVMTRGDDG
jgi:hypothetical protein